MPCLPLPRLAALLSLGGLVVAFPSDADAFELPTAPLPRVELASFDTRTPEVSFDVPRELLCHDVTTDAFAALHPGERLVRVEAPVTLLLYHGEAERLDDVVIEIDGAAAGLRVIDYSPRTALQSELAEPIEVKQTRATDSSLGASLGGKLSGDVALTPTVSGGRSWAETDTTVRSELPPKRAVVVSGAIGGRSGVYYKLRSSTQSTLEGERVFEVTFAAPADWRSGDIEVRCLARGEKKWLWVEQRRVWTETTRPVRLRLASAKQSASATGPVAHAPPRQHTVAKPIAKPVVN